MSRDRHVICMKAACAWWNSKEEKCAVACLDTVASSLQRICEDGITTYPT